MQGISSPVPLNVLIVGVFVSLIPGLKTALVP